MIGRDGSELTPGREAAGLLLIFLVGVFLRVYLYPDVPPGLNQDEAAAAYEAYSLLRTGSDQWGNPLPVHFPGWGAGQSVLYSYLTIPAIGLFGLTRAATRSTNLICGLLTLPLVFHVVSRWFDRRTAWIALTAVAVLPWHVMMSRWGLDANLLPFFLLLGCATVTTCLLDERSRALTPLCLVPWALGLYAYGLSLLVTPFLVALLFLAHGQRIRAAPALWGSALATFLILAAPLALYVGKDYFVKGELGIEPYLPFTVPSLPSQRLSHVQGSLLANLAANGRLMLSNFDDGRIWNSFPPFAPLFLLPTPLFFVGLYFLAKRGRRALENIFLLWAIACLPLLALVEVNLNRGNAVLLPIVVISSFAVTQVDAVIRHPTVRTAVRVLCVVWVVVGTALFASAYFRTYTNVAGQKFRRGLGPAIQAATRARTADEAILVTDSIPLDYMNVLYLQQIPPEFFHAEAEFSVGENGLFDVHRVGPYHFDEASLRRAHADLDASFVYLLRSNETAPCMSEPVHRTPSWHVGRCAVGDLEQSSAAPAEALPRTARSPAAAPRASEPGSSGAGFPSHPPGE